MPSARRLPWVYGGGGEPAREAAAYLSSYFLGGGSHKAKPTDAVLNTELPRLPLYVSRGLTALTRTTMQNSVGSDSCTCASGRVTRSRHGLPIPSNGSTSSA